MPRGGSPRSGYESRARRAAAPAGDYRRTAADGGGTHRTALDDAAGRGLFGGHRARCLAGRTGLAIDAYERTLISNQTRFDQNKLSEAERRGLDVFLSQGPDAANPTASAGGKCVNCHTGRLFSGAAVPPRQPEERVERMIMGDNGVAFYDGGFYNIGVVPTQNDLGVGATDPWGNPLSFARQHITGKRVDDFGVSFAVPCSGDCGDARGCRRRLQDTEPAQRRAYGTLLPQWRSQVAGGGGRVLRSGWQSLRPERQRYHRLGPERPGSNLQRPLPG